MRPGNPSMVLSLCRTASFGIAIALLSTLWPVSASARYDVRAMSCARAQNLVEKNGVEVFTIGDGVIERFVTHLGFCVRMQTLSPGFAKTKDNPQCVIAYVCTDRFYDGEEMSMPTPQPQPQPTPQPQPQPE